MKRWRERLLFGRPVVVVVGRFLGRDLFEFSRRLGGPSGFGFLFLFYFDFDFDFCFGPER